MKWRMRLAAVTFGLITLLLSGWRWGTPPAHADGACPGVTVPVSFVILSGERFAVCVNLKQPMVFFWPAP